MTRYLVLENAILLTHLTLTNTHLYSICFFSFCRVLQRITERQNKVVITDRMWARLLSSTNQPSFLSPKDLAEVKKESEALAQSLDGEYSNEDRSVTKDIPSLT